MAASNGMATAAPAPARQRHVLVVGVAPEVLGAVHIEEARAFRWTYAPSVADAIIGCSEPPDLVILGGDASEALRAVEGVVAARALAGASLVAWPTEATGRDVAMLTALGARVALASPASLLRTCDEALEASSERDAGPARKANPGGLPAAALDLTGIRVVVADDDPAAAWFFADTLRSAGCSVVEATDGQAALEAARRTHPDVVLSDIRMPRLSGVRLCAVLRGDPLLGDVPVVLLSWREDWLPEACRKAGAAGSLTKRSTPEQVLSCVRAAIAPRAKLERRLREPAALRGRLDGVTPYRLLRAVCEAGRDARVTLQSATHRYEIRVREGAPATAMCIAEDRSIKRGEAVLLASLSMREGRFAVVTETARITRELFGTLHEQISRHVAVARGLAAATPLPEALQTIPMRMPGAAAEEEASFELPRASAALVDLPVRTVPMLLRRAAVESTLRLVFPKLTEPARRARGKAVAPAPPRRRHSVASAVRAVVVATLATLFLGLLGGLDASTAPQTASSAQESAGASGRADAPAAETTAISPRASRMPAAKPR
jgi:two-component system phosphate regulon response regulator PhoB